MKFMSGLCTGLEARFFNVGYKEINDVLVFLLESKADELISPQVFPSYAILL